MQALKIKIRTYFKILVLVITAGLTLLTLIAPEMGFAASDQCQKITPALSTADMNACEACIKDQSGLTSAELNGCIACTQGQNPTAAELNNCLQKNPIIGDLDNVINFLSAGAGIVIVGSIIFGGIQYSMAGNNPNAVSAAKKRITDSLIALLAFFFIYAFLNWLIPGGLLFS